MNPIQYAVLWHLANSEIRINELMLLTKIDFPTLRQHMINFFNPKHSLLIKESAGKKLTESERVRLNDEFESKNKRINFMNSKSKIQKKIVVEHVTADVDIIKERKYKLEAVVIKIVKSKRKIQHKDLIVEIIKEVKDFTPELDFIKETIENLIFRALIRRDEALNDVYNYIDE